MDKLFNLDDKKTAGFVFSVFSCLYIVITFIVQSVMLIFTSEGSFSYYLVCALVSPCVMLFICFFYNKKKGTALTKTLPIKKFNVIYIPIIILTVFGMYFGLGQINQIISNAVNSLGLHVQTSNLQMDNIWQFFGFLLGYAILPAISEELFFRGFILEKLKKISPTISIIFSALLFALYHGNISQLAYQFIYGIIFALIFLNSDSVIPCMIIHFLNNFIVLLFLFINVDIGFLMGSPVLIVLGAIAIIIIFVFLIFNLKKKITKCEYEKSKWAWAYASLGIVLTALLVVLGMVV